MSIQIFVSILLALSLCSAAQHVSPSSWEILELLISDPGFLQPSISTQCCAACSGCCQAQLQLLVGSVLLLLVNDLILLVEGEGGGQVLLHVSVELLYVQLGLEEEPGDVPPDNHGVGCLDAGHGCCSVYVCFVRCVDCDCQVFCQWIDFGNHVHYTSRPRINKVI